MTHNKVVSTGFFFALFELILQRLSVDSYTSITYNLLASVRRDATVIAIQLVLEA